MRQRFLNWGKILLLAVSFVVATGLYLHVQSQVQPNKQREFVVRLEQRALPEDLIAMGVPERVRVIAEGSLQQLDRLDTEQISAFINLAGAAPGKRSYSIQINAPTRLPVAITPKKPKETLQIERLNRRSVTVLIETRGVPPADLHYEGQTVYPDTVTVVGPATELQNLSKVRAMLDLSKLKPGDTVDLAAEVLGDQNRPLRFSWAEPLRVQVSPALTAAAAIRRVPVSPVWRGQPEFGFRVLSYELRPPQLQVTGDGAILGQVSMIETEPINLDGLQTSTLIELKLKVPKRLRIVGSSRPRVFVKIGPAQAPGDPSIPSDG